MPVRSLRRLREDLVAASCQILFPFPLLDLKDSHARCGLSSSQIVRKTWEVTGNGLGAPDWGSAGVGVVRL